MRWASANFRGLVGKGMEYSGVKFNIMVEPRAGVRAADETCTDIEILTPEQVITTDQWLLIVLLFTSVLTSKQLMHPYLAVFFVRRCGAPVRSCHWRSDAAAVERRDIAAAAA